MKPKPDLLQAAADVPKMEVNGIALGVGTCATATVLAVGTERSGTPNLADETVAPATLRSEVERLPLPPACTVWAEPTKPFRNRGNETVAELCDRASSAEATEPSRRPNFVDVTVAPQPTKPCETGIETVSATWLT